MPSRTLTSEQVAEICQHYRNGMKSTQICHLYGVSHTTVLKYLKLNGITPVRKYVCNSGYFDHIDTEEQAYFLGLLFADGCNITQQNTVRIGLQENDVRILNRLTTILFPGGRPLLYIPAREFTYKEKIYHSKPQWRLVVCSKHISNALASHGMVRAKSLILKFPSHLPPNLVRHFVRGYFDGDGCLHIDKHHQGKISITSSKLFCQELQAVISTCAGLASHLAEMPNPRSAKLNIGGSKRAIAFLNWLYTGSSVYLERKKLLYDELLAYRQRPRPIILCAICGHKAHGHQLCLKHYRQQRRSEGLS